MKSCSGMQILPSHLVPGDFVFQKALTIYPRMLVLENARICNEAIYSESIANHLKAILSSSSQRETERE